MHNHAEPLLATKKQGETVRFDSRSACARVPHCKRFCSRASQPWWSQVLEVYKFSLPGLLVLWCGEILLFKQTDYPIIRRGALPRRQPQLVVTAWRHTVQSFCMSWFYLGRR